MIDQISNFQFKIQDAKLWMKSWKIGSTTYTYSIELIFAGLFKKLFQNAWTIRIIHVDPKVGPTRRRYIVGTLTVGTHSGTENHLS